MSTLKENNKRMEKFAAEVGEGSLAQMLMRTLVDLSRRRAALWRKIGMFKGWSKLIWHCYKLFYKDLLYLALWDDEDPKSLEEPIQLPWDGASVQRSCWPLAIWISWDIPWWFSRRMASGQGPVGTCWTGLQEKGSFQPMGWVGWERGKIFSSIDP